MHVRNYKTERQTYQNGLLIVRFRPTFGKKNYERSANQFIKRTQK
jgi:hypothetical protein